MNKKRVLFGMGMGLLGGGVIWRLVSRRHTAPCPPWLIWLLENPFVERRLGASVLLDRLDVQLGMRFLDVGCGSGRITLPAAQRVGADGEAAALNIQDKMIEIAQGRAEAAGAQNIRFILAGAGEGVLPENYFDRAVLSTVLGEIPDKEAALQEIYRALKPGGRLAVAELIPDPHYQPMKKVRALSQKIGFAEIAKYSRPFAYTMILQRPM